MALEKCCDRTWDGGRIWRDDKGRTVYVIRKQVNGRRYEVSTRAHTLLGAIDQLRRFEADPEGYDPRGVIRKVPIRLTEPLVKQFLRWSLKEKRNTKRWVGQQKLYLAWWSDKLKGVDLRGASLAGAILPKVKSSAPARAQKIAVLKVLYTWLRTVRHLIATVDHPTYGQLSVPQSKPEPWKRVKAVSSEQFQLAIDHLAAERWRDLLLVLGGTGMHVSELDRFAATGDVEPFARGSRQASDVAGQSDTLAAARRVLAAGSFDRVHFQKAVKSACEAAEIPPFGTGQLRHSVATWAINAGADVASVSDFLGHRSPRTTRKFRATHAAPKKDPTPV
jgi:integrase